jgi:hypothetical protein
MVAFGNYPVSETTPIIVKRGYLHYAQAVVEVPPLPMPMNSPPMGRLLGLAAKVEAHGAAKKGGFDW